LTTIVAPLTSLVGWNTRNETGKVMTDREAFVAWLDDLAARLAVEAKRRNLSEGEAE
jgi:hypothetical protein